MGMRALLLCGWAVTGLLGCSEESAPAAGTDGGTGGGDDGAGGGLIGPDNDPTDPPPPTCISCTFEQTVCGTDPKESTRLVGTVTAPNGIDPIAGARVFIPNDIGDPIVITKTEVDGSFSLFGVPFGEQVPLFIEKGGFLRTLALKNVESCTSRTLTADEARLPKNQKEGRLPKLAVGQGDYDQIECVLRTMGVDDSEFTSPTEKGAIHLYNNRGDAETAELYALFADAGNMAAYDLIFVNCTAWTFPDVTKYPSFPENIRKYVDGGGRLYATDWAYDAIEQVPAFSPYIDFYGGTSGIEPEQQRSADYDGAAVSNNLSALTASVSSEPLASWLEETQSVSDGQNVLIQDFLPDWALMEATAADQATYPSTTWVHGTASVTGNQEAKDRPLTVTFERGECGRVLYSSYHTRHGVDGHNAGPFPSYCRSSTSDILPQERILEYLILELSACERELKEPLFPQPPK